MPSQTTKKKTFSHPKQKVLTLSQLKEGLTDEDQATYQVDLRDAGRFGYASLQHTPSEESFHPRYFLDDSLLYSPYGHPLPPILADLLDVAAAVIWIDRHYLRTHKWGPLGKMRGRERSFDLTLGVRRPEVWERPEIKSLLEALLGWLSEDHWNLTFVQQINMRRLSDIQPPLFSSPPSNAQVVLYSGGLDSLAGTVSLLRSSSRPIVLVSAVHGRQQGIVNRQVKALQGHFGEDRIHFAPLPFKARHQFKRYQKQEEHREREESTQRTRGFLFLTFGAAAGVVCNASQIAVCENGPGSINLPYNWQQLGTTNTRATHPRTLVWMTRLVHLLGLSSLHYEAPHLFRTKAELCADLRRSGLGALVPLTVSCDSFPLRIARRLHQSENHCGYCTSCLLRRQALFAAQLETLQSNTYYLRDVCRKPVVFQENYLEPLKHMLDQRQTIEAVLSSANPEEALFQSFPELITVYDAIVTDPDAFGRIESKKIIEELCNVYRRYIEEWQEFPFQLFPN